MDAGNVHFSAVPIPLLSTPRLLLPLTFRLQIVSSAGDGNRSSNSSCLPNPLSIGLPLSSAHPQRTAPTTYRSRLLLRRPIHEPSDTPKALPTWHADPC